MIDIFKMVLGSPFGSFSFVLGIMILGGWLIYYVTKKVTHIQSDHSVITKFSTKTEGHIDEIRKDLSFLKGVIEIIRTGANPLTQSHSPISLTEKGKEVSTELKAEEIVANNWKKIYTNLETNISDKNAYDIQTYCMETAAVEPEKFFDVSSLNLLKQYSYKNGNPLSYYSGVFGIIIRDKYLEIKGIDVAEVDASDPNNKK